MKLNFGEPFLKQNAKRLRGYVTLPSASYRKQPTKSTVN